MGVLLHRGINVAGDQIRARRVGYSHENASLLDSPFGTEMIKNAIVQLLKPGLGVLFGWI